MMYTVQEIYDYLDALYPFVAAADWDNSGLLIGDGEKCVNRAAVALDITSDVVLKAAQLGCELIISHHPVIFRPIKSILAGSPPFMLIKHGISAICAHTSLDVAQGGVNDALAAALELQTPSTVRDESEPGSPAFGRKGTLANAMSAKKLAEHVKARLGCTSVRFTDGGGELSSLLICSGTGSPYYLQYAIENGVDAMVTGEVKHHEYLLAKESGLTLLEAGHFATERVICQPLAERLRARFTGVEFTVIDESEPYLTV